MEKTTIEILEEIEDEIAEVEKLEYDKEQSINDRNYYDAMSDATQVVRDKIKQLKNGNN